MRRYRRARPTTVTSASPTPTPEQKVGPLPVSEGGQGGGPPPVELGSSRSLADDLYGLVIVGPWPSDFASRGSDDRDMNQPGEKEQVVRHLCPTTSKRNNWRTPSAR